MDYSYFAAAAPQPYQFMGLPPTPAHTNIISADEFSNGSPPDAFSQFQNFDAYNQFNANGVPEPPSPQSQHRNSIPAPISDGLDGSVDMNGADNRQGSNSDDEDMTPAQSRRKAQNRAAQRAFRERKEKHVKELEAQVAALKQASSTVSAENEMLKLSLQKVSTENEILKATSHHSHNSHSPSPLPDAGPMRYSPKDFYTQVLHAHENKTPSHRIVTDTETGDRLLAAGATWDFIIQHPLFKKGMVDVAAVSEKLKGVAKCDGQGPVFEEKAIVDAIEKSVASGSDELM